ncbi:MAG TPA: alanyl-tRNA editing protein [Xanthobacteraceae bacterium]|jgi:misacylated tRNA(Ala) deacylase|nr:alanyl-tRNA editing protein [Xanthobacteraceae bacterium]
MNSGGSIAMTTECLFREDAYLKDCTAKVVQITEQGGIVLDRTVAYANSGGQPGDIGTMSWGSAETLSLSTAVYTDPAKTVIAHVPASGNDTRPSVGETIALKIDWELRYRRMRMHTALHLLSAVLPYPVTGGSIGENESRLDFDIPDAGIDKDEVTAKLMAMINADAAVTTRWISDAELEANPGLIKTMSVKPPMGTGRVRLVEIEGLDLQPCGGTHVRRTSEIGAVRVTQIEKKGKQNRRVRVAWG